MTIDEENRPLERAHSHRTHRLMIIIDDNDCLVMIIIIAIGSLIAHSNYL